MKTDNCSVRTVFYRIGKNGARYVRTRRGQWKKSS